MDRDFYANGAFYKYYTLCPDLTVRWCSGNNLPVSTSFVSILYLSQFLCWFKFLVYYGTVRIHSSNGRSCRLIPFRRSSYKLESRIPSPSRKFSGLAMLFSAQIFFSPLQDYYKCRRYRHDNFRHSTHWSRRAQKAPPHRRCWNVYLRIHHCHRGCYSWSPHGNSIRHRGQLGCPTNLDCIHLHVGCPLIVIISVIELLFAQLHCPLFHLLGSRYLGTYGRAFREFFFPFHYSFLCWRFVPSRLVFVPKACRLLLLVTGCGTLELATPHLTWSIPRRQVSMEWRQRI